MRKRLTLSEWIDYDYPKANGKYKTGRYIEVSVKIASPLAWRTILYEREKERRITHRKGDRMGIDMTDTNRLISFADEFDYDRYTRREFEEMRDIFRENTEYVYRMHDEVMELLKPRPGSRTAAELEANIETFSANRQIVEEQFEDIEREYDRRRREEEEREEEERRMRLMREEEDAERREEEMRLMYPDA